MVLVVACTVTPEGVEGGSFGSTTPGRLSASASAEPRRVSADPRRDDEYDGPPERSERRRPPWGELVDLWRVGELASVGRPRVARNMESSSKEGARLASSEAEAREPRRDEVARVSLLERYCACDHASRSTSTASWRCQCMRWLIRSQYSVWRAAMLMSLGSSPKGSSISLATSLRATAEKLAAKTSIAARTTFLTEIATTMGRERRKHKRIAVTS
mmetsp:Transcript_51772/g.121434  ORF Transcript_51772/g.121434 Transcript_51772/m.121434 type:complete len:216 (+) Transcript_51772:67-714(+)